MEDPSHERQMPFKCLFALFANIPLAKACHMACTDSLSEEINFTYDGRKE